MPIFMDVHIVPGVKAREVAQAHTQDLLHQEAHHCKCMTYWIDETRESVFCLIEAPDKESVIRLHSHAHGLIPNKIIEVNSQIVESFLGRIYDPKDAVIDSEGLKVFEDPSLRVLLITKSLDPVLLAHELGTETADDILRRQNQLIRESLANFDGREVEHASGGFVISFASASRAVACALAIQSQMDSGDALQTRFRSAIHAGEPLARRDGLFEDTIRLAGTLCCVARNGQVAITSAVRELIDKDKPELKGKSLLLLSPQDEQVLESLFEVLSRFAQDPGFDSAGFSREMAMSTSQLYRKTLALTGQSPNNLLKEYRLENAKGLLKKKKYSVSQITFDCGFTSPSYFTKCFKKQYGMLPMEYLDQLR